MIALTSGAPVKMDTLRDAFTGAMEIKMSTVALVEDLAGFLVEGRLR